MALQRRENAKLCNDPSDFEVRMDEGEAHAKTRRSYDLERDALRPHDRSKIVFEPSQQKRCRLGSPDGP